jgi:hypothetical protein
MKDNCVALYGCMVERISYELATRSMYMRAKELSKLDCIKPAMTMVPQRH